MSEHTPHTTGLNPETATRKVISSGLKHVLHFKDSGQARMLRWDKEDGTLKGSILLPNVSETQKDALKAALRQGGVEEYHEEDADLTNHWRGEIPSDFTPYNMRCLKFQLPAEQKPQLLAALAECVNQQAATATPYFSDETVRVDMPERLALMQREHELSKKPDTRIDTAEIGYDSFKPLDTEKANIEEVAAALKKIMGFKKKFNLQPLDIVLDRGELSVTIALPTKGLPPTVQELQDHVVQLGRIPAGQSRLIQELQTAFAGFTWQINKVSKTMRKQSKKEVSAIIQSVDSITFSKEAEHQNESAERQEALNRLAEFINKQVSENPSLYKIEQQESRAV